MASATFPSYPHRNAPINLMVDASNTAVGAVLQQQVNDDWQPISFFSRSLSPRERKYSTFDRELLATFLAVKHFQHHLHNPNFHILTDHKPLIYAINSLNTHHAKHIGWIIFPSLQRIFDTFMGYRILWQMFFHVCRLMYLCLLPQSPFQNLHNNSTLMWNFSPTSNHRIP